FYYILTRSNWRSWMVWGAWFLTGHGLVSTIWLVAGWLGVERVLHLLVWPAVIVSLLATAYTGVLFAHGLAPDLWQGPSAAIDLVAQSTAAGSAALLLAAVLSGGGMAASVPLLGSILIVSLLAHLVILAFEHLLAPSPTRHHELAVQTIRRGAYAPVFWWLAIGGGGPLPLPLLLTLGATSSRALAPIAAPPPLA